MKKSFRFFNSTLDVDINTFLTLPLKERMKGAGALMLFNLAIGSFVALGFFFNLRMTPESRWLIILFFLFLFIISLLFICPLVIPSSIKYKKRLMAIRFIFIGLMGYSVMRLISRYFDQTALSFTKLLVYLLGIFAMTLSTRLYLAIMRKSEEAKHQMETDLRIAQEVQTRLAPDLNIDHRACRFFGKTQPFGQVGGDLFDFLELPDGRVVVTLGDVSGHDIAAGLLMAITRGAFRTEMQYLNDPVSFMRSLNRTLYENSHCKMFVTFLFVLFDFKKQTATVINAGHPPMLHCARDGAVQSYARDGIGLGMMREAEYRSRTIEFNSGDHFILFSDGLIESQNASHGEYGMERLTRIIRHEDASLAPQALYRAIMDDQAAFSNDDDITLAILKVK